MNLKLIEKGKSFLSSGRLPEAYEAFVGAGCLEGEVLAGVCAANMKEFERSVQHFEKAYKTQPQNRQVRRFLGMALSDAGDYNRAIALLAGFDDQESLFFRGRAYMGGGKYQEAIADFQLVVKADPRRAPAWANLGICSRRVGDSQAERFLNRSLKLQPDLLPAILELAELHREQGKSSACLTGYLKASLLEPKDPLIQFSLGQAAQEARDYVIAQTAYSTAIELAPEQPNSYLNRSLIYAEQGQIGKAKNDIEVARRIGAPWVEWREALMMPLIAGSNQEIDSHREMLERWLGNAEIPALNNPVQQIGCPIFALAYQGRNNSGINRKISKSLSQACPQLAFTGSKDESFRDQKRIVFASSHFRDHTVGLITEGIIHHLDREKFEVHVVRPFGPADEVTRRIEDAADQYHVVSADPFEARKSIADLEADAIYFADIGMEPWSYYLGFARMARFQCVGWGHADTPCLPEIDSFISCDGFDPANATEFYGEELLRTKRVPAYLDYQPHLFPKNRETENSVRRIICPQSLFKIHPDMDQVFELILENIPNARIYLPKAPFPHWEDLLIQRLGQVGKRIEFLPRVPADNFTNWLAEFDAIIDPIHFTGGFTSFQALSAGLPVVTWNGSHLPGRMTLAMLNQMELQGLSASDPGSFVEIVRAVSGDPVSWRKEVFANRAALIADTQAVREF